MASIALDLGTLSLTLEADDRLTGHLDRVKRNVSGMGRDLGAAGDSAGKSWGSRLASGIGSAASTVASAALKVAKGVGLAAGASLGAVMAVAGGTALTKGFDRLKSLDQAQASLRGLGHDAASVEAIMKNANAAVKGTAFGMGEAAQTAASAVAAGVKPGEDLQRTLKLVGDAATIGGTGMGEMGAIFNKVAASNKIQMGEMNQLMDRGIPIQQMLAKHLGVSVEEVQKLSSAGKIGFADFQAAMEAGLGGAAASSGETFAGALKNVQAALGRLGAAFLGPAFEQMAPFFQKLIPLIDRLAPLATRAGAAFGAVLAPALDLILRGAEYLTGVFERNQEAIFAWASSAGSSVSGFGAAVRRIFSSLDLSGLSDSLSRIGAALKAAFSDVGGGDPAARMEAMQGAADNLGKMLGFLADNMDKIVAAIPFLVGGFMALKAAQELNNLVGAESLIGHTARTASLFANAAATFALASAKRAETAATVQNTVATTADTTATNVGALAKIRAAAGAVAHRVAMVAAAVAARTMAAAQWVLNAALTANPIGLVIAGIVLLVAGLVLLWQRSETFRNVVIAVWTAIRDVALAVVNWFVNTALPILQRLWDRISAGFTVLSNAVIAVIRFLVNTVVNFFTTWRDRLVAIARFIWDTLTRGWQVLRDGVVAIVTFLVDRVVTTFTTWRDRVVGLVANIRDWVLERFEALRSGAIDLFRRMVDGIGERWERLRGVASAPVRFIIDTVINDGIIKGWNDLVGLLKLPESLRVGRISVPGFARGGVMPGQASGRGDNMVVVDPRSGQARATIRSGEGILPEPVTRDYQRRGVWGDVLHGRLPNRVPGFFMGGVMPTTPGRISQHRSGYGFARWAGDMARPMGAPVYAWNDGTVAYTRRLATSYGNHIMANHGALGSSLYAHLSRIMVAAGQQIRRGQQIGAVGSTGNSTGPHLHFEVRGGNAPISASGSAQGTESGGMLSMALGWITDKLASPVRALLDRIPGAGVFVDAAKGMGTKLLDSAVEKIKALIPGDFLGTSGDIAGASWQGNANLLMRAGRTLSAGRRAMQIALMTAAQESSMGTNRTAMTRINRDGDVGWFQQRATRGDGTVAQLADPLYALGVFLHGKRVPAGYHVPGLYNIRGWESMAMGAAAQRVQVSAYPRAYDKWAGPAAGWMSSFGYAAGTASAGKGFAWTGEKAAELVLNPQFRRFDGGERVLNGRDTAAILGGGKDKERPIEIHLHQVYDPELAAREVVRQFEFAR